MKTVKTSELSGRALDWAVAQAVGGYELIPVPPDVDGENEGVVLAPVGYLERGYTFPPKGGLRIDFFVKQYSGDWSESGNLVEKYSIELVNELIPDEQWGGRMVWSASCNYAQDGYEDGDTPCIAICRAVVAVKIGQEVSVPEELLK